jgi:hypothetical protein
VSRIAVDEQPCAEGTQFRTGQAMLATTWASSVQWVERTDPYLLFAASPW